MEMADPPHQSIVAQSQPPDSLGRLPLPLTSMLAREREIAEVASLVRRDDVRLLTLTGPGGVGKTRLAIAVANEAASEFADGVTFVDLASVRDPDLVAPAIAHALGMGESGDRSVQAGLVATLRPAERLLVLDNLSTSSTPVHSWWSC